MGLIGFLNMLITNLEERSFKGSECFALKSKMLDFYAGAIS